MLCNVQQEVCFPRCTESLIDVVVFCVEHPVLFFQCSENHKGILYNKLHFWLEKWTCLSSQLLPLIVHDLVFQVVLQAVQ